MRPSSDVAKLLNEALFYPELNLIASSTFNLRTRNHKHLVFPNQLKFIVSGKTGGLGFCLLKILAGCFYQKFDMEEKQYSTSVDFYFVSYCGLSDFLICQ